MILPDRSAECCAEIVLMELRNRLGQPIRGVKKSIAIELENVAVKLVGATLDNGVNDRARVASIFRVDRVGNDVEFLQGIYAGNDYGRV